MKFPLTCEHIHLSHLKLSFALVRVNVFLSHPPTHDGFIHPFHLSDIRSLCTWCTHCSAVKAFQVGWIAKLQLSGSREQIQSKGLCIVFKLYVLVFFFFVIILGLCKCINLVLPGKNTPTMWIVNMQGVIAHYYVCTKHGSLCLAELNCAFLTCVASSVHPNGRADWLAICQLSNSLVV